MEADSPTILIKIGGSTLGSEDTSFADVAALQRQGAARDRDEHGELAAQDRHAAVFDGQVEVVDDRRDLADDARSVLADRRDDRARHARRSLRHSPSAPTATHLYASWRLTKFRHSLRPTPESSARGIRVACILVSGAWE